jgi:hypothetical protein
MITDNGPGTCDQSSCNGSPFSWGPISSSTSVDRTLTLYNQGGAAVSGGTWSGTLSTSGGSPYYPMTSGTWAINWKGGSFPGTGGTCFSMLAVGSTCTVVITLTSPSVSGNSFSGNLSLSYQDGSGTPPGLPATRYLQGND